MVERAPVRFDPARLAEKAETLGVELPLSHFRRLARLLDLPGLSAPASESAPGRASAATETPGQAEPDHQDIYRLDARFRVFRQDDRICIDGRMNALVPLICQRCLCRFDYHIDNAFSLVAVQTEAEAESLDEALEPIVLAEDGCLHIVDLFEDELILQLPIVPKHTEINDCRFDAEVQLQITPESGAISVPPAGQANSTDAQTDNAIADGAANRDGAANQDNGSTDPADGQKASISGSPASPGPFDALKNLKFDD